MLVSWDLYINCPFRQEFVASPFLQHWASIRETIQMLPRAVKARRCARDEGLRGEASSGPFLRASSPVSRTAQVAALVLFSSSFPFRQA